MDTASPSDPPVYDKVVNPTLTNLWRWSTTDFDAAGRPLVVTAKSKTLEVSKIRYAYQGDRTLATPDNAVGTGGTAGRTITGLDAWGQPRFVAQYQDSAATILADRATYTYTGTGPLDTLTKDLGAGTGGSQSWDYDYDWAGRRTHTSDPDTGDTSTEYDENSNPWVVTVPDGADSGAGGTRQLTTTYDVLDRPTFLKDSGKVLSSWTYYASDDTTAAKRGMLATATSHSDALGDFTTSIPGYTVNGPSSVTYTYPADLLGTGAGTESKTVSYTYNDNGQVATTTLPAAAGLTTPLTISHTYTTNAAPFSIKTGSTGDITLANYIYDNHNRTTGLHSVMPSPSTEGLRRDYDWDLGTGGLKELKGSTTGGTQLLKLEYAYDSLGNPQRIAATSPKGTNGAQVTGAWCYTYDGLSRLATGQTGTPNTGNGCADDTLKSELATGPRYDVGYGYLKDRLRTSSTKVAGLPASTVTYGYDPAHPHQATSLTADLPTAATEPIQPTLGALAYDNAGRVTTWSRNELSPSQALVAASTVTSTYDERGNLAKTVTANAATPPVATETVDHAYDSGGLRIARRVTTPTGITTTLYLGDAEITRQTTLANAQGTLTATRMLNTQAGTPLGIQNNDGSYDWLLADQQHSVRLARHVETNRWINYHPYGDPVGESSALPAGRGYLNKTHDPGGDIRLDHRAYSPTLNILTTPDPLLAPGDPQSANPYAYARNNPITGMDPSGLKEENIRNGGNPCESLQCIVTVEPQPEPEDDGCGMSLPCHYDHFGAAVNDNSVIGAPYENSAMPVDQDGDIDMGAVKNQAIMGATADLGMLCLFAPSVCASIATSIAESVPGAEGAGGVGGAAGASGLFAGLRRLFGRGSLSALEQGAAKVPSAWGGGIPNTKGVGTRWFDPAAPQKNGIRIDAGIPGSSWPSQQVDHVVVRSGGQVLGPDAKPIVGSIKDNPQAHIPLSEWLNWRSWNAL